jgi:hypothetical protein
MSVSREINNHNNNKEINNMTIFTHSQPKKIYNELLKFKDYLESFY